MSPKVEVCICGHTSQSPPSLIGDSKQYILGMHKIVCVITYHNKDALGIKRCSSKFLFDYILDASKKPRKFRAQLL